jgi:hypothetical protein
LKFNRSFEKDRHFITGKGGVAMRANGIADGQDGGRAQCATRKQIPLLARFASKFMMDILPAALASVIGGFLFTQYQFGRTAPPQPALEQISPASVEVLALVRDEHAAIISYLDLQMAAEKSRLAAQDAETASAVADAKAVQDAVVQENEAREKADADLTAAEIKLASVASNHHGAAPGAQAKIAVPRARPTDTSVAGAHAPLVIAQVEKQAGQNAQQNEVAPQAERLARDPESLLAKTLDLKDHVVAATWHAVTAIADTFASVGERIGGAAPNARPFSSDS